MVLPQQQSILNSATTSTLGDTTRLENHGRRPKIRPVSTRLLWPPILSPCTHLGHPQACVCEAKGSRLSTVDEAFKTAVYFQITGMGQPTNSVLLSSLCWRAMQAEASKPYLWTMYSRRSVRRKRKHEFDLNSVSISPIHPSAPLQIQSHVSNTSPLLRQAIYPQSLEDCSFVAKWQSSYCFPATDRIYILLK